MPNFTQTQIEKLELLTGHSNYSTLVRDRLTLDYSAAVIEQVEGLIVEIASIDALLKEARDTSFVMESRGSRLSYSQHVAHLKAEGTRALRELVQLLDISLAYNKYAPRRTSSKNYW